MSDIPMNDRRISVPPFGDDFRQVIRRIRRVLSLNQFSLAYHLGVEQPRCNVLLQHWLSGTAIPDPHKLNVLQKLHTDAVLRDFRCDSPHYVCDLQRVGHAHTLYASSAQPGFSDCGIQNRGTAALATLKRLAIDRSLERSRSEHELDIYIRAGALPANLRTVCFGDAPKSNFANTFIVLVNSRFAPKDRYLLAWNTVFMYIAKRLRYTPPSLIYAYDSTRQRHIRSLCPVNDIRSSHSRIGECWPRTRARTVIDRISRAFNYTHSDIAAELDCAQGTIAKWYQGVCDLKLESRDQLTRLYLRSGARLLRTDRLYILHADPPQLAFQAELTSFETLCDALFDGYELKGPANNSLSIDLHIRLADLVPDALAHTIVNRPIDPDVFFVLVDKNDSDINLTENSWTEAHAHVVQPTERKDTSQRPPWILGGPIMSQAKKTNQPDSDGPNPITAIAEANQPVDTTWVEQHSEIAVEWKKAIARYSAIHYVRYGDVVQIGSGTQMRTFIEAIQDRQHDQDRRLDLLVLTSNLEVVAKGRQPGKYPMRIILTGGEMLESLYCLAGEYAAKAVSTELFFPRVVVLGAAGIKFTDQRPLSYHFPDEVSTQVAYATRPTQHRIIMCDHTKFGFHDGLKADLTLGALLEGAETCTVVTSMPDDDRAAVERLEREEEALRQSLRRMAADKRYDRKDFVLEFVSRDAVRVKGLSLKEERDQASPK